MPGPAQVPASTSVLAVTSKRAVSQPVTSFSHSEALRGAFFIPGHGRGSGDQPGGGSSGHRPWAGLSRKSSPPGSWAALPCAGQGNAQWAQLSQAAPALPPAAIPRRCASPRPQPPSRAGTEKSRHAQGLSVCPARWTASLSCCQVAVPTCLATDSRLSPLAPSFGADRDCNKFLAGSTGGVSNCLSSKRRSTEITQRKVKRKPYKQEAGEHNKTLVGKCLTSKLTCRFFC